MICENIRIWIRQFFVDLDASTKRFSRPPQVQLNYAFDKLPWWSLRTTGSLADASYADRSASSILKSFHGAKPVGPSRPIANELGKEAAR